MDKRKLKQLSIIAMNLQKSDSLFEKELGKFIERLILIAFESEQAKNMLYALESQHYALFEKYLKHS